MPGLLRAAGWSITTLAEHYGIPDDERVDDVTWLLLAGGEGWAVLMKDDRIRYRPAEREALIHSGVTAFCLASGNLTAQVMAETLTAHRERIWSLARLDGPAVYTVARGSVRPVDL